MLLTRMALTRDFKETIKARAERDPEFREQLLAEAAQTFLSGDFDTAKALIRDYINVTIGFETLGNLVDKSPRSIMRKLGPNGNPRSSDLFEIISFLQEREGIELIVKAERSIARVGHF